MRFPTWLFHIQHWRCSSSYGGVWANQKECGEYDGLTFLSSRYSSSNFVKRRLGGMTCWRGGYVRNGINSALHSRDQNLWRHQRVMYATCQSHLWKPDWSDFVMPLQKFMQLSFIWNWKATRMWSKNFCPPKPVLHHLGAWQFHNWSCHLHCSWCQDVWAIMEMMEDRVPPKIARISLSSEAQQGCSYPCQGGSNCHCVWRWDPQLEVCEDSEG